jgi:hypothetical protein
LRELDSQQVNKTKPHLEHRTARNNLQILHNGHGAIRFRDNPELVFLSLEDEMGISDVFVNPDLYEKYQVVINREKFLRFCRRRPAESGSHHIHQGSRVLPISITAAETQSHDFH